MKNSTRIDKCVRHAENTGSNSAFYGIKNAFSVFIARNTDNSKTLKYKVS